MIGEVQSLMSAEYGIPVGGKIRSYGPTFDLATFQDELKLARTGMYGKEILTSSSSNYIGVYNGNPVYEDVIFLAFDTSFLMGEYPTSAEIEIEFANVMASYVDPIETQVRLASWVPPLTTDHWLTPAEFSAAPLLASIMREYLGENHASGSRVTVTIEDPAAFTAFNPTGVTGIAIAYGVFARDTYQTTWKNRIAWAFNARPTLRVLTSAKMAADQPSWGRPSRVNSLFGVLDTALGPLDTELASTTLAQLGEVSSGFLRVTLDPGRVVGDPEIVHITQHVAGAETATIRRAAEATTPRNHPAGVAWEHAPTVTDYRLATLTDVRPDIYIDGAKKTLVENPNWDPLVVDSPRYVAGPSVVYADIPPDDAKPGTTFISRSGDFFDYQGRKL